MDAFIELVAIVGALLVLDALAIRFGVDSRKLERLDSPNLILTSNLTLTNRFSNKLTPATARDPQSNR
jgi:hypothetical protein